MIRTLAPLLLLTACAQFPQLDAAAPETLPARPVFLSPAAVAAINAQAQDIPEAAPLDAERDLQSRADALRNQ